MSIGLPLAQGLYDPRNEHDSCGVGFIVDLKGRKSHQIVRDGLTALNNLNHRGACGCENNTGDGAGLLIQIPHEFLVARCRPLGIELPEPEHYGVGAFFTSPDESQQQYRHGSLRADRRRGRARVSRLAARSRPTRSSLGESARRVEPVMWHAFVGRGPRSAMPTSSSGSSTSSASGSRTRSKSWGSTTTSTFTSRACRAGPWSTRGCSRPSSSASTSPTISATRCCASALCMFHSRFSTNTFPSWELAHPYRMISHNGEINTLRGNINWMKAREALFASDLYEPGDIAKIKPIIREGLSDTACLDNAVELLVRSGYSLPHAMMMLIPEAWENHESMSQVKKDFYRYHSCLMEPWDGPASVTFTDGKSIGAVLDRNGLRPSRYVVTDDDRVIMASEVGALEIAPERIVRKGRLEPGKMFLVDLEKGRIVDDDELKHALASAHPYGKWLDEYMVPLADLPRGPRGPRPRPRHAAPPPDGVRLHARGPQVHPGPDGVQRRGGDRVDGHRHAAGGALRPGPAALQLLQAALRPGHQSAAGRDPRGAGDLGLHRRRRRGEPARPEARILPADRARDADPRQRRAGAAQAARRLARLQGGDACPCSSRPPRGPRGWRPRSRR